MKRFFCIPPDSLGERVQVFIFQQFYKSFKHPLNLINVSCKVPAGFPFT